MTLEFPAEANGDVVPNTTRFEAASKLYSRLHRVTEMTGQLGLAKTIDVVYHRLRKQSSERLIELNNPEVRYPLLLTATSTDVSGVCEIFESRVYDLPESMYSKINDKPIIDVGAYIGLSAAWFASHYEDSPVIALEPDERNAKWLDINAEPYGSQITPVHAALSPDPGPAYLVSHQGHPTDYMAREFSSKPSQESRTLPTAIQSVTPQQIIDRLDGVDEIGVLKIDIEGAEKALCDSGAIDELLRRSNVLLIEAHDNFVPGCSQAIASAAQRTDLASAKLNKHTYMYVRGSC